MATEFKIVTTRQDGWRQYLETFNVDDVEAYVTEALRNGEGIDITEREVSEYETSHQWDDLIDADTRAEHALRRAA